MISAIKLCSVLPVVLSAWVVISAVGSDHWAATKYDAERREAGVDLANLRLK